MSDARRLKGAVGDRPAVTYAIYASAVGRRPTWRRRDGGEAGPTGVSTLAVSLTQPGAYRTIGAAVAAAPHDAVIVVEPAGLLVRHVEFREAVRDPDFGNGRGARKLFGTAMVERQAEQLADIPAPTTEQLRLLLPVGIPSTGN